MAINLLFVDDDVDFEAYIQLKFQKKMNSSKYHLNFCTSAEQALAKLNQDRNTDIVICDLYMPGMNGFALLSEVNKLDNVVRVIMISSDNNIENMREAMNRNAFDFIKKPIDFDDLELTLSKTYKHILSLRDANRKIEDSYRQIQKTMEQTIQSVATIGEIRDPYTAGHQRRVAQLAKAIAIEMGLPQQQAHWIYVAGMLHDIGKVSIPTEILSRPGGVTDHEMTLIRDHAQAGFEILKGIEFPWPVAEIVLMHHERLNGSGYPRGLSGDKILLEAKIIAVADSIEAISSFRPYRPAMGIDRALQIVSNERYTLYDSQIVDICFKLFLEKGFEFDYNCKFSD